MMIDRKAFTSVLTAYGLWGLYPIYFTQLANIATLEVFAHRIFWSFVLGFLIILCMDLRKSTLVVFKDKKANLLIFLASLTLSVNWFTFLYAVTIGEILQTSLGYFISPLLSFVFSVVLFKEKLSKAKKIAVIIAFCAISFEVFKLGIFPFMSILIALSWAAYGSLKKYIKVSSIISTFVEIVYLLPCALIYLIYLYQTQSLSFLNISIEIDFLLIMTGVLTLAPLILFSYSVIKIPLSVVGFFQYLVPTMGFLTAIFIYDETLNFTQLITFIAIWIALIIFSLDMYFKSNKD